jgi:broad specificity phosphatase PhoE
MTRLLLVRHAEAAASWEDHDDPGLSPVGVRQAEQLAADVPVEAGTPVVSSPLARTRATAAPLAERLGSPVRVDGDFGEVPTPPGRRAARGAWLRDLLDGRWVDADGLVRAWRRRLLDALDELEGDTVVVVTHFVAINVAVGAATGSERMRCCSPAHCSVTDLARERGVLRLVGAAVEASTGPG